MYVSDVENFESVIKMDEDQWRYDFAMSQEVHMDYDYDNQEECGVNESHVDCSNAFNTWWPPGSSCDLQRPSIDECSENCVIWVYKLVVQISHRQECQGQM